MSKINGIVQTASNIKELKKKLKYSKQIKF